MGNGPDQLSPAENQPPTIKLETSGLEHSSVLSKADIDSYPLCKELASPPKRYVDIYNTTYYIYICINIFERHVAT